jgi:hypothetical protein
MENVKEFVEKYLEDAELFANTREDVEKIRAIAFGGVLFAYDIEIISYNEVREYWDNWALEKFEEIARTKGKGPKVEVI